jgi:hypothetical protein
MNKKLIFSVMLICILAFVAVVAFGQNSPNVRWEYTAFDASGPNSLNGRIEMMNRLGREGWELVTNGYDDMLIFKRRLP